MVAVSFLVQTAASVGVALAVLIAGWLLNRDAEHKRWLRETRLEVYADFLKTAYEFDKQVRLAARGRQPDDVTYEQVQHLEDIELELKRIFDRMRLVGSGPLVRVGMTILKSVDKSVEIEVEEHHSRLAVYADGMLASTYLEWFSAGVRREMGADGFWARHRKVKDDDEV